MDKSDGYHRLATLMSSYPDVAIFRRFMFLNALNLLALQAELSLLEDEFKDFACQDRESKDPERIRFEFCFATLKASHDDAGKAQQWKKFVEIRAKLNEYHEAWLRFQHLASAMPANESDLYHLREWLDDRNGGHCFLSGIEEFPWSKDKNFEADLASLTSRDKDKDALSRWIDRRVIPFCHDKFTHRWHDPISIAESSELRQPLHYYPDSYVSTTMNILSTILSSVLPTLSFFALYFIHGPLARMAAIVAFTFLFSTVLAIIANPRRVDCFAAATAFAAVQVVFVGVGPVGGS